MSNLSLEQRVAALERKLANIEARNTNGVGAKPWLRTMGMFAGDEGMKEIFDEALKIRDDDRQRTRRRVAKKAVSRRVKS